MRARLTRRISSSLLPLNMTPAMTSIHPPLWWNGPLGPLTTGRDLYGEDLHGWVRGAGERFRAARAVRYRGRGVDHFVRGSRDRSAPLLVRQSALDPPCRAQLAPPLGGRESSIRCRAG